MRERRRPGVETLLTRKWPETQFETDEEGAELTRVHWEDGPGVPAAVRYLEEYGAEVSNVGTETWNVILAGREYKLGRDLKDRTCALIILRAASAGIELPESSMDFARGTFAALLRHSIGSEVEPGLHRARNEEEDLLLQLTLDLVHLEGLGAYQKLKTLGRVISERGYEELVELARLTLREATGVNEE